MPCLSGRYQAPGSPLIDVGILDEDTLPSGNEITEEQIIAADVPRLRALIDTGASRTCLSKEVARAANLLPVGKREMISASGITPVNTYLFSLGIPFAHDVDPTGQIKERLAVFRSIEGMEFNATNSSFDVLLGMDVLSKCSFKMDFDGHFSLCW